MELINIMSIKGYKQIFSKTKYPINEDTVLELKGEFRSSGKTQSKIYFGLRCFKENREEILAPKINRIDEPLLITSINTDGKRFTVNKTPEKWCGSDERNDYKYLGLYYDGNIERLPDYLIKTPAYKNFVDNNIYLNEELPKDIIDKIIPFQTRVMNHKDAGTYDYSAACYNEVPEIWTEFKAEYQGFSVGYGDIKGKFRPGTRIVNPFVLCNYGQNKDAILEIKNIEVFLKDKPKFL